MIPRLLPEDGSRRCMRNVGSYVPSCTASRTKRQ